jgi:hypothetical protein
MGKKANNGMHMGDPSRRIVQKRPYTCVVCAVTHQDVIYNGIGFSKVKWPDPFDADEGIRIATRKALADIWKQAMNPPAHFTDDTPYIRRSDRSFGPYQRESKSVKV